MTGHADITHQELAEHWENKGTCPLENTKVSLLGCKGGAAERDQDDTVRDTEERQKQCLSYRIKMWKPC